MGQEGMGAGVGGIRAMMGEAGALVERAGFLVAPVERGERKKFKEKEEVGVAGGGEKTSDFPFHPS